MANSKMCKELVKVQGVKLISHIHYASTISQQYSQMYNTQFTGKENEASDKIQPLLQDDTVYCYGNSGLGSQLHSLVS